VEESEKREVDKRQWWNSNRKR